MYNQQLHVQAVYSAVLPPSLTVFFHFVTEKGKELKSHPVFGFVLGHSFNPGISAFPASNILDRAEVHTAQDSTCFCGENSNLCFIGFKEFYMQPRRNFNSFRRGGGRSFLKIYFFIESGLKMIQFKIHFKTKSEIFIQKDIHSIESRTFN